MRIARVLTRLNLGGPARQVLASDPLLGERGHKVRLFTGTPGAGEGDLFDLARERGLDVVRVPGLVRGVAPLGDLAARRFLANEIEAFSPDVLHTHAAKAGTLGRRATRHMPGLARVHTFHGHVFEGYFPEPVAKLLVAHERRLARRTDRLIAVSHATADDLVRLGVAPEDKLVVIPPGIDLAPYLVLARPRDARAPSGPVRDLCGVGPDDFLLGFVARLVSVKRPELAFEVFEALAGRHRRLHLVFVGDGELRGTVERRIAALDDALRARVHLVGAMRDMPPVFGDLDGVLLTSHSEGMPVALIEAAAAGLPAIATNVGGVSEIVAHERTGFVGETPAELAFGLDQVLANPTEAGAMGQRARVRVAQRHSAAHLADRLEELYRTVVEEHACAS
jgi:glycosyltransferase involved in cell wall biosynthesis